MRALLALPFMLVAWTMLTIGDAFIQVALLIEGTTTEVHP